MKATTNRCLKTFRELTRRGEPITSQALVEAIDIQPTKLSTALDIAAGWISTLRRYGFLRKLAGVKVKGPQRSLQVYKLTDWGKRFKAGKPALQIAANPPRNQG